MNSLKLWRVPVLALTLQIGGVHLAHSQSTSAPANDSNQSWISTESGNSSFTSNPTRATESHTESDGRITDTQSVQRRGMDGRYENYLDSEKETVKVNASTTRTVERVYGRDPDGRRTLVRITEEETRTLPGNETTVIRTTSNPDLNGALQVAKREIQETRQSSPDVQDTKTTVLSPSVNGGLTPSVQREERQTRRNEHLSEFRKSTSLPDGNGNWRVSEVRQGTIEGSKNGTDQTREESVMRPDAVGRLTVVEKNISHESKSASGDKSQTIESFSKDVPGGFGDGTLRLSQRQTSVERSRPDGTKTREKQLEQRNPGDPDAGLRPTEKTIDIVRPNVSGGSQETRTIESRDANGNMGVVWVDTRQVTTAPSIQVDTKSAVAAPDAANKNSQVPAK
jgi:hypothetical protein